MRAFTIILIFLISLFDLYSQSGTTIIQSNRGKYVIMADYTNNESSGNLSNFKLYKLPFKCDDFVKINATYPIYWSADDSFFVCNDYCNNTSLIKIFNTRGLVTDTIRNANCPFIYGNGIYYYFDDLGNKDRYQYSIIMYYDLSTKKSELIYKFGNEYSFDMEGFGTTPLSWENNWPGGLLGRIFLEGKEENTYTFLISDKKLIYWIKGDYTKNRNLPDDGLLK